MEESDADIFQPALCSPKHLQRRCGGSFVPPKCSLPSVPEPVLSLWDRIPLPDLHEPETIKTLYQGQKILSRFGKDNKKTALSDGKRKSPADFSRNELMLVHTSEMTLDYCFFCHDKKHFL